MVLITKHDVITILSKDTFLNQKEKKKTKERFPDYTFLFYFYSRQVTEELSLIYLWKQFLFTNIIHVSFLHMNVICIIELHNKQNIKEKEKCILKVFDTS